MLDEDRPHVVTQGERRGALLRQQADARWQVQAESGDALSLAAYTGLPPHTRGSQASCPARHAVQLSYASPRRGRLHVFVRHRCSFACARQPDRVAGLSPEVPADRAAGVGVTGVAGAEAEAEQRARTALATTRRQLAQK